MYPALCPCEYPFFSGCRYMVCLVVNVTKKVCFLGEKKLGHMPRRRKLALFPPFLLFGISEAVYAQKCFSQIGPSNQLSQQSAFQIWKAMNDKGWGNFQLRFISSQASFVSSEFVRTEQLSAAHIACCIFCAGTPCKIVHKILHLYLGKLTGKEH